MLLNIFLQLWNRKNLLFHRPFEFPIRTDSKNTKIAQKQSQKSGVARFDFSFEKS